MTLFYGDLVDSDNFCSKYGKNFIAICNDEILIKAINMTINNEYKTIFVNGEDGNMYARKVYNDGFIWPRDFKTRIINFSDKFRQKYGLFIYKLEKYLLIGDKLKIKGVLMIDGSNGLANNSVGERKIIDSILLRLTLNWVSKGNHYLIQNE